MFGRLASLAVCLLILLLAVLPLRSDQSGQNRTGYVLVVSVNGTWSANTPPNDKDPPLQWGDRPSSGCVFGKQGSSIVLTLKLTPEGGKNTTNKSGDQRPKGADAQASGLAYLCENKNVNKEIRDRSGHLDCPAEQNYCSVDLDSSTWTPSGWARFFEPLLAVIEPHPDRFMVAVSRGVEEELVDSVVPIQGNGVDLSAAFRELDNGQYWVKISSLKESASPAEPLPLQYKRGSPAIVTPRALQPSLYNVSIVDKAGEPAGSDCWVLATDPADYPSIAAKFEHARADSEKFPAEMDPSATRSLLRAYLESLADQRQP